MKKYIRLLKSLKKQPSNKAEIIKTFGEQLFYDCKFYDWIEETGTNSVQITLVGRDKLFEYQISTISFLISAITLLIAAITLAVTFFQ